MKEVLCFRQAARHLVIVSFWIRKILALVVVRSDSGSGFATVGYVFGNFAPQKRKYFSLTKKRRICQNRKPWITYLHESLTSIWSRGYGGGALFGISTMRDVSFDRSTEGEDASLTFRAARRLR